jgi:hypothetical protein
MIDLLKEARMSVMTIGATKYNKPSEFINSDDYEILCNTLNHYEELLKKEEGVKPIKCYKRIGLVGECVEETYDVYECECGHTLCDNYAGML